MNEIKIIWKKIGSVEAFLGKTLFDPEILSKLNQPGIYFWVEKSEDANFSNYIGKAGGTSCVLTRLLHHIEQQLTLKYSIPKKYNGNTRYVHPKPSKGFELKFGNNKEYDVRNPNRMTLDEREKLLNSANLYLKNIELYFCVITEYDLITEIESQLIKDLCPVENSQGTARRVDKFKIIHDGVFKEENMQSLKENAVKELKKDSTRPNKSKY